jgi:hypothetical protein
VDADSPADESCGPAAAGHETDDSGRAELQIDRDEEANAGEQRDE